MTDFLLKEFVTIFAVSAVVVVLFNAFKQPPIAGFIITGILVGPSGFAWIHDAKTIHVLADIGLIFLLFSIGIEFSIKNLSSMRRAFFGVGALQIAATTLVVSGSLWLCEVTFSKALLCGFLVSLSSTAIVLNLLHRRREVLSPQGSLSISVLLFQDLFAVPLLLALPLFTTNWISDWPLLVGLLGSILKATLLLVAVLLSSRYFVPLVLRFVTGTGVRELFLMTIALLAFGSAWLGSQIGVSVVFGAFLAGVLVSETQYGHQVVADLVPLREPFVALFFVSIGMLLDLNHFLAYWPAILALAIAVIVLKAVIGVIAGYLWHYDLRVSAIMGLLLAQIGEFSFVLAQGALLIGLLSTTEYQSFLSLSVLTMLVSPSLALVTPKIAAVIAKYTRFSHSKAFSHAEALSDHVIVIGLGVIGRNLAKLLLKNGIGFVGIETDPRLFHRLDDKHLPVIFGDGARAEILDAAGIRHAQLAIVSINDPSWTAHIVGRIRELRPDIRVIVRCQHFKDMEKLSKFHVDEFVVGEAQMAVEFSERVLKHFGMPQDVITSTIEEIEAKNYKSLRQG